jgi:hypothetical protein
MLKWNIINFLTQNGLSYKKMVHCINLNLDQIYNFYLKQVFI